MHALFCGSIDRRRKIGATRVDFRPSTSVATRRRPRQRLLFPRDFTRASAPTIFPYASPIELVQTFVFRVTFPTTTFFFFFFFFHLVARSSFDNPICRSIFRRSEEVVVVDDLKKIISEIFYEMN